jgi:DMSO reductase family type II enzyme heme b subunit
LHVLSLVLASVVIVGCARREAPPKAEPVTEALTAAAEETSTSPPAAKTAATAGQPGAAKTLYVQHCSACHGERGDGQGLAARFVFPKPRNFRGGLFRLVSTTNGVPTKDDIVSVLKRGMPGSAMPPWPKLRDEELELLAGYVVDFRRDAIREQERALAAEGGYDATQEDVERTVSSLTTPGPLVEVPAIGQASAESIARGKLLYMKTCASCHGLEGKGDGQQKMADSDGIPTRPRDLTRGIFKGTPDPGSIYRRILAGMPGSPMPATRQVAPAEISDLVHFILSLSDEKSRQATVLNRENIVARYAAEVPESPAAPAWNDVSLVRLRLAPLWWRNDFEPDLEVQAVHDGQTIAFRLSWKDDSENASDAQTEAFADAVAMELYRGNDEPFLGMGAASAAIDLWFWDADRQAGFATVQDVYPRTAVDVYPLTETVVESAEYSRSTARQYAQAPETLPAQSAGNQISPAADAPVATSLEAAGPGSVTFRPRVSQLVRAQGEWKEGRWAVVMTRELSPKEAAAGVALTPGHRASVAFAVWEGSHRDRNGQKLFTIWQDLELEPAGR